MARNLTIKQERALTNLVADGGSIAAAMKKANYSKNTARTPKKFTESPVVRPKLNNFLQRLKRLRDKVTDELERKDISHERFTELSRTLKDFNHDIQLLSGGVTEREEVIPLFDYEQGARQNNRIQKDNPVNQ